MSALSNRVVCFMRSFLVATLLCTMLPEVVISDNNGYLPDSLSSDAFPSVPVDDRDDTLTIALLLPLQMEANREADTATVTPPVILKESLPALHFMESALMLRDTLAKRGVNVIFKVVDTGFDSLATVTFLRVKNMSGVDAVISLLPLQYHNSLSQAAQRWAKPVWFFSAPNTKLLEKNTQLRLMVPSNTTQIRLTAAHLAKNHSSSRFITVFREQRRENDIAAVFSNVVDSIRPGGDSCHQFNYTRGGWVGLKKKLSLTSENILIIPTTDESFLSTLINDMGDDRKSLNIRLCGMPAWENFQSIDQEVLAELRVVFFNGLFIDGEYGPVVDFRKRFMITCHADPLPQAFLAHDAILNILRSSSAASDEIKRWPLLLNREGEGEMVYVSEGGGLENRSVNILRFGEMALIRVN